MQITRTLNELKQYNNLLNSSCSCVLVLQFSLFSISMNTVPIICHKSFYTKAFIAALYIKPSDSAILAANDVW